MVMLQSPFFQAYTYTYTLITASNQIRKGRLRYQLLCEIYKFNSKKNKLVTASSKQLLIPIPLGRRKLVLLTEKTV